MDQDPRALRRLEAELEGELPGLIRSAEGLRQAYLRIIRDRGVPHAAHIADLHAWAIYVYHAELIARLLPDRRSVIVDWGGLYGQVTNLLRSKGYDHATNYLLHLPASYRLFEKGMDIPTVRGESPNRLNLPSMSVDAFVSSGVLEHVREDGVGREDKILAEMRRSLRPGGLLFIWNLPTILAPADLLAKTKGTWHHRYRYTPEDVRRLVKGAGLQLVRLRNHGGTPLGVAMKVSSRGASPGRTFAWDHRLATVWPFSAIGQNLFVLARKPT